MVESPTPVNPPRTVWPQPRKDRRQHRTPDGRIAPGPPPPASTTPMDSERRAEIYRRQNRGAFTVTARQYRRWLKKMGGAR